MKKLKKVDINPKQAIYSKYVKRIIDFTVALILILYLSPIFILVSIIIRVKLGSPVIFKQKRPGLNKKNFTMYKFRTMTDRINSNGEQLPDWFRLTKIGKLIRSTSIDEIPELFNILKGDMSIVGPRPLLTKYLPYYTEKELLRNSVRPGITGLAQVNGRNALNWEKRFEIDVSYVLNMSLLLDIKILIKTIMVVIKKKDILSGNEHILKDLDIERQVVSKMNKDIKIKILTRKDIMKNKNKILELFEETFKISFDNKKNYKKYSEINHENMIKFKKDGSAILFAAMNDEELVGFVWAYVKTILGERKIHVEYIMVDRKYRSFGIGKKLLKEIEIFAKKVHIKKVELMVTKSNENAIRFYKSNKFTKVRYQLEKNI